VESELNFEGYDAVILGAAHDEYAGIDFEQVAAELVGEAVITDAEGIIESDVEDIEIQYERI